MDPAYRHRGVGRLIVDTVIDWTRAAGARQLLLSVALGPTSALEFYRRAGFLEIGQPIPLRDGSTLLQQTMRRTL